MNGELTIEAPVAARKRGRPKKTAPALKPTTPPLFGGMAERHPIAYAVAVLRLIGNVSTEDEVKALAGGAAQELEAAGK